MTIFERMDSETAGRCVALLVRAQIIEDGADYGTALRVVCSALPDLARAYAGRGGLLDVQVIRKKLAELAKLLAREQGSTPAEELRALLGPGGEFEELSRAFYEGVI